MRFLPITLVIAIALSSCAHNEKASTPAQAEKNQSYDLTDKNLIAPETEKALGEAIFTKVVQQYKLVVFSDDFKAYTSDIVKKLAENSNRPDLEYQVFISPSKDFFAFGLPGGKILISKGVFDAVKNESEYANVIANQIAHIAKQHLIHDLMRDMQYHNELLSGSMSDRLIRQSVFTLTEMGYEIEKINEADRLAPTYAMHVGYDTKGLLNVLEALQTTMVKNHIYGNTDFSSDMINHRASMNGNFVKALESADKSGFPKVEDRYAAMLKKIKPVVKKK